MYLIVGSQRGGCQISPVVTEQEGGYTLDNLPVGDTHSCLRAIQSSHVFGVWEEAGVPQARIQTQDPLTAASERILL